ncbi:hypothetical protein BJ875DRAFT_482269 [Amylocarpus encephaloides]|uniref:AB hydrolase-1 domain-containing protein n=1 Tax=Amylocarpus encephaloides TaxID=45428 RepID=A0A9P8C764_9HELO|nr:hypothetical protein BJ875DRAFT_482269 [Amylocarpus encephaloides]
MLPPPTLSFTIPSVHDDLVLDCRVYHPVCLAPTKASDVEDWQKKAAIIAHPYAPLGGSYDDPVVDLVAGTILKQGFCVGTFNFRGAGSSKGRTSWQSKAEQLDYISMIGFMCYYMHFLSPPPANPPEPKFTRSDPELHDLTPAPSAQTCDSRFLSLTSTAPPGTQGGVGEDQRAILLLGGYSYGAMVTSLLPAILSTILAPFQEPALGSTYAEIRMRAESLATQQNEVMQAHLAALIQSFHHKRGRSLQMNDLLGSPNSRKSSGGVRMGGEEDLRRASHDTHRSRSSFTIETEKRVRKGVDRVRSFTKSPRFQPRRVNSAGSWTSFRSREQGSDASLDKHVSPNTSREKVAGENRIIKPVPAIGEDIKTAYLLTSPLHGMINSLATMFSSKPSTREKDLLPEPEFKLGVNPTLALFGDDDVFVSVKKLRAWAEKLEMSKGTKFRYREVSGAGHFWHDLEALAILQEEVKLFARGLGSGDGERGVT